MKYVPGIRVTVVAFTFGFQCWRNEWDHDTRRDGSGCNGLLEKGFGTRSAGGEVAYRVRKHGGGEHSCGCCVWFGGGGVRGEGLNSVVGFVRMEVRSGD